MSSTPRVWLITGTSSGLSLALTREALDNGDIVVATLRNPDAESIKQVSAQYPPERLLVLKLDVTKYEDIVDAFARTKERFGRLDVVVNNAAYAMIAEIEGASHEVARTMFETNFWGGARLVQEAVKFLREVNPPGRGGRIIHISSATGMVGYPAVGFYSASKHAMEGLMESLSLELDPEWNIKVTIVPLGAHATNGVVASAKAPPHPAYTNPDLGPTIARKALLAGMEGGSTGSIYDIKGDITKAVKKIYLLGGLPNPPLRLILGKDSLTLISSKVELLTTEMEMYASWSEGLEKDD